jgi:acetyl esterase/lipase
MLRRLTFPLALVLGGLMAAAFSGRAQEGVLARLQKATPEQLQALLPRFPEADADRDGVLTREEALAHARRRGPSLEASAGTGRQLPPPSHADVAYGSHERHVLDFWRAPGDGARPLVILIHGGGFTGGDKSKWRQSREIARLLESGISCAAINYRLRQHAPIQDILRDIARSVQFLRAQAAVYGIDKTRVAAWGGSAGAGSSLWLGSRDDLAEPDHADPVRRESSRVQAVVLNATQATYDLTRWEAFLGPADPAWWTSPDEAAEFYHFRAMADLAKPEAAPVLRECDMLGWISRDDAPVFVSNPMSDVPARNRGHYLHHPAHAREIQRHCEQAGVPCHWLQAPEPPAVTDPVEFVRSTLGSEAAE